MNYRWIGEHIRHESGWLTSTATKGNSTSWLILGSDKRDGTASNDGTTGFRTDTILVLTRPKQGTSSLISIPRDSLVKVNDAFMKINAVAELAGKPALVHSVEEITGVHVDHVAFIQFGGLQDVVNAAGGITVCYDHDANDPRSGLVWKAGCHHVDGATALAFSRMRYEDANGDFGRTARQREVIRALISQVKHLKTSTFDFIGPYKKMRKILETGLKAVTFDDQTTTINLAKMGLAFIQATSGEGITGTLYWKNPGYYVNGVGSTVLLDDQLNHKLFDSLSNGTRPAGVVGTLADVLKK